jgi:hypothetical protein
MPLTKQSALRRYFHARKDQNMEAQTPRPPANPGAKFGNAITGATTVERAPRTRTASATTETTMHALRRILGDGVLDIFPDGLIETVDQLFTLHADNISHWAEVPFDTEQERDDALKLMRAYAECADDPGYTIRTDKSAELNELRFRVVVRRGSAGVNGDASESDTA